MAVLLVFGSALAAAQDQTQATPVASASTISVDARLVNIPVVVHDKKGALVQTLTKDNFILKVDGHDQAIRYFNQDTDLPLTLGLLVDTSQSQRSVLDEERAASIAFLNDLLNAPAERDKAFVVQFAVQTDLLQEVTGSKPKLQAALKKLEVPALDRNAGRIESGADNSVAARLHRAGVGTTLYDALFLSSDSVLGKQKGRKAVIILSDGGDFGSKETLAKSIEAAQRADTIVYAIYFKGDGLGGGRGAMARGGMGRGGMGQGGQGRAGIESREDGKKVLQRMADETGGWLFEVKGKETLAAIYKQIGDQLRAQYRLGYTPDKETAADGYHQIGLSVTAASPKDLYIQTR